MQNNEEIRFTEARKITSELKASILKLDALNQEVLNNIQLLEEANVKLKGYLSILSRFDFQDEAQMTAKYSSYLAYLSKKIEELSKNSSLKRVGYIVQNSARLTSFSIWKLVAIITICNTGIWFLSFYRA